MLHPLFWVFIGGGIGSVARWLLAGWVMGRVGMGFPYGILAVNLIGCFLIGLVAGSPSVGPFSLGFTARLFLVTGFLGGLTTFSSYEYDSFQLLSEGAFIKAFLNLGLSVVLGLMGVWLGYMVMRGLLSLWKVGW